MHSGAVTIKRFPPRGAGVLVPVDHRAAAAAGVCMYTACRPSVLSLQSAAFWIVRNFGARMLPGPRSSFSLPGTDLEAAELRSQWEERLGRISAIAVYRRRQRHRLGLTMVAVGDDVPLAVIKLREEGAALDVEQRALTALALAKPQTFMAPRPMGLGRVGAWHWSMQESVFDRPHRPVLRAPAELFEEVREALSPLFGTSPGLVAAHRDLTPWNLRRSAADQVHLFDWEDCGLAPVGADRTYFAASSRAVGGPAMPGGLPQAAIDYHRAIVSERHRNRAAGITLPARILSGLDEAQRMVDG